MNNYSKPKNVTENDVYLCLRVNADLVHYTGIEAGWVVVWHVVIGAGGVVVGAGGVVVGGEVG